MSHVAAAVFFFLWWCREAVFLRGEYKKQARDKSFQNIWGLPAFQRRWQNALDSMKAVERTQDEVSGAATPFKGLSVLDG